MSMSIKEIIVPVRRNTRHQLWGEKEMASKHVALGFFFMCLSPKRQQERV